MNLSPLPIQKFFDNNGRPLAGGLLFTYEVGTSNKIATYIDESGVTPNTNPIVLDFRGECRLWINPLLSYKYVLAPVGDTDPPTSPIWSVDKITAGPAQQDNAAIDTGSVNNIALAIPQISSPVAFTRIVFKVAVNNTGPVTISINGGTAKALTWKSAVPLSGGEIFANSIYEAVYDGAQWQLQSPSLQPGDVRLYGAYGNGVQDDTVAIAAALAANAGKKVVFPKGTYIINSSQTIPVNTDLIFEDGVVLDCSSALITGTGLLSSVGTLSSALGGGLAANVDAGDFTITLNSAPGLAVGDLIILRNTTDASWYAGSAGARQGEFLEVKSLSGAVITLASAAIDTYVAGATVGVYLVTPTTTCIKGKATIIGNPADTANLPTIFIRNGRDNEISGLVLHKTTATCIELNTCFRPSIHDVDTGKYLTDAGSIQASGVVLASCQYGHVYDCILYGDRHGASTGGGGTVVDRFNVFEHCAIASRTNNAADFHANAEFCEYRGNHISGAVNYSGARNKIIDNDIYPNATITSLINFELVKTIDCWIERNRFYLIGSVVQLVLDASDTTDINADTVDSGTMTVRDNKHIDYTTNNLSYYSIRNNGSTAANRLEFTGNEVLKADTSTFAALLAVSVVTGDNFSSLLFQGNTMNGAFWGSFAADEIVVRGNSWHRSGSETQQSTISGDASNIYIESNDLKGGGTISIQIVGGGTKNKLVALRSNTYANNDLTTGIPVVIANAERVQCSDNLIGDESNTAQVNPISFNTVDFVQIVNDVYIGNGAPDFSSVSGWGPSTFTFDRLIVLGSSTTEFAVWLPPTGTTVMPTLVQGRVNADITATNGNFWSFGVNAASRRTDYGVCTTAAASSVHAKNAKLQRLTNPVNSSPLTGGTDTMSLMSVDSTSDAANIASAMGGSAAQIILFRARVDLIGNLPSLP